MERNSRGRRFYETISDYFGIKGKIVLATVTFLILLIIALVITVAVLNVRIQHGGAPIQKIILDKAINKSKTYDG